jgi:hypothetical protein
MLLCNFTTEGVVLKDYAVDNAQRSIMLQPNMPEYPILRVCRAIYNEATSIMRDRCPFIRIILRMPVKDNFMFHSFQTIPKLCLDDIENTRSYRYCMSHRVICRSGKARGYLVLREDLDKWIEAINHGGSIFQYRFDAFKHMLTICD